MCLIQDLPTAQGASCMGASHEERIDIACACSCFNGAATTGTLCACSCFNGAAPTGTLLTGNNTRAGIATRGQPSSTQFTRYGLAEAFCPPRPTAADELDIGPRANDPEPQRGASDIKEWYHQDAEQKEDVGANKDAEDFDEADIGIGAEGEDKEGAESPRSDDRQGSFDDGAGSDSNSLV